MLMVDFEFGGELLSSHGFVVGCINTSASDSVQMGSSLTLNTVKNNGTSVNGLINTSYDEVITATFDIFKDPCEFDNMTLEEEEIRDIMSWIPNKQYQKFKPLYDDGSWSDLYFRGTFTSAEGIFKSNADCIGFTFVFTADAPWGYAEQPTLAFPNVTEFSIGSTNITDEAGFLYPNKFKITANDAGDLYIRNSLDEEGRYTVIKNLSAGEVITMNCEAKIIETSDSNHERFFNDYNYNFPRIVRNYNSLRCLNTYNLYSGEGTGAFNCDIEIDCIPIRKVGVLP